MWRRLVSVCPSIFGVRLERQSFYVYQSDSTGPVWDPSLIDGVFADAILFGAAWLTGGIAILFILLLIGLSVLIGYFKENDLHKWLERCEWGKLPKEQRYDSLEEEQKRTESRFELSIAMEYTGLIWKYKLNRELTNQERRDQLKQTKRLDVEPIDQLSVIKKIARLSRSSISFTHFVDFL